MQKISAGKFQFEPPFTSFDHLVAAGEELRRDCDAECPGGCDIDVGSIGGDVICVIEADVKSVPGLLPNLRSG
jgi:hypothetical protein